MTDEQVVEVLNEIPFQTAAAAIAKAVTGYSDQQKAKAKNPPKAK